MTKFTINVFTTHMYSTVKEFATQDEASTWADEQAGTLCLDDEADWSFDNGEFETEISSLEDA